MNDSLHQLWVYLAEDPLLALTLTLVAYVASNKLYEKCGKHPLLNPVLLSIIIITSILLATDISYEEYFEGAQFVHFLLGPATVALAIPLYRQFQAVKSSAVAIMLSLFLGSLTAIASAVGIAWFLGANTETLISLAPKSVTTPVAMGITEKFGGLPSLTAVFVILSGIIGAALGRFILDALGVRHPAARGLALGVASHGIGAARSFQVGEAKGAFASLAMGLNALATAILLPILMPFF